MASCYFMLTVFLVLLALQQSAGTPLEDVSGKPNVVLNVRGRPRNEIDLTTEKQVLLCAGQNKSLECVSPGSSIAIMDSFWGRLSDKLCPSEDGDPTNCPTDPATTGLIKRLCDDKVFCQIPARHTVLQNPGIQHCPGVNKYLIVNYTCIPNERKFVLCSGETTKLLCGQGWKLNLMSAFWGRTTVLTCPTPLGHPSRFGTCENLNGTVDNLKTICQGRGECVVRADDLHMAQGRSYCPDVEKYAMISYKCQPDVQGPNLDQKVHDSPSEQNSPSSNPAPNVGRAGTLTSQNIMLNHAGLKASKNSGLNYGGNKGDLMKTTFEQNLEKQLKTVELNQKTGAQQVMAPSMSEAQDHQTTTEAPEEAHTEVHTDAPTEAPTEAPTKAPGKSLDREYLANLLREYLQTQSQQNDSVTEDTALSVPHDSNGGHVNKEKQLPVPHDSKDDEAHQHIERLKELLRNKGLMNVGSDALIGILKNVTNELTRHKERNAKPSIDQSHISSGIIDSENGEDSQDKPGVRPIDNTANPTDHTASVTGHAASVPQGVGFEAHQGSVPVQVKTPLSQEDAFKLLSKYSHKSEDEVKKILRKFKLKHMDRMGGNADNGIQEGEAEVVHSSHGMNQPQTSDDRTSNGQTGQGMNAAGAPSQGLSPDQGTRVSSDGSSAQETNGALTSNQLQGQKQYGNVLVSKPSNSDGSSNTATIQSVNKLMPSASAPHSFEISDYQHTGISFKGGGNSNMVNVEPTHTPSQRIPTAQAKPAPIKSSTYGANSNSGSMGSTGLSAGKMASSEPTERVGASNVFPPTVKVGGKILGNALYEQYLKDVWRKASKGAVSDEKQGQATIKALSKKITALQTISDALGMLTDKMSSSDEKGNKRHHNHHGDLALEDGIDTKDVDFIQNKINDAITMAESMGRHEIALNPRLVALKLAGRVSPEVSGQPRDEVEKATESIIEKQIKAIEGALNSFADSDEVSVGANQHKPTVRRLGQRPRPMIEVAATNESAGTSLSSEGGSGTLSKPSTISGDLGLLEHQLAQLNSPDKNIDENVTHSNISQKPAIVHAKPNNVTKAANSIAKALRRQTSLDERTSHFVGKNFTIALKPVPTFQDFNDAAVGGRINNEVIKVKEKEKLFKGKDMNTVLNMMRASAHAPTPKSPMVSSSTKTSIKEILGTKLDENTLAILEKVVKHLLLQKQQEQNTSSLHKASLTYQSQEKVRKPKPQSKDEDGDKDDQSQEKVHKPKPQSEDEDGDKDDDEPIMVFDNKYVSQQTASEHAGKKDQLDQNLLDQLDNQLEKLEKAGEQVDGTHNSDAMNAVPNDGKAGSKPGEEGSGNIVIPQTASQKPKTLPTDDDINQLLSSFSGRNFVTTLLQKLQDRHQAELTKPGEEYSPETSALKIENAEKSSLNTHFVAFSGAELSGKIGTNSEAKSEKPAKAQAKTQVVAQLSGGKILQPGAIGLKPKSQETFSFVNVLPTTKSKMTEPTTIRTDPTTRAMIRNHNRLQIGKIVKGVRMLLKALRGQKLKSSNNDDDNKVGGKDASRESGDAMGKSNKGLHELYPDLDGASQKNQGDVNGFHNVGDWFYPYEKNKNEYTDGFENSPPKQDKQGGYGYLEYGHVNQDPYYQMAKTGGEKLFKSGSYNTQQLLNYDSQYDQGIVRNLAGTNPSSEYTDSYGYNNEFSNPYSSYAGSLQPQGVNYMSPASLRRDIEPEIKETQQSLPKTIRHALDKALKSDPVLKLVESFASEESHLMKERFKGIAKHSQVEESKTHKLVNSQSPKGITGKVEVTLKLVNTAKSPYMPRR